MDTLFCAEESWKGAGKLLERAWSGRPTWACATRHRPCHQLDQVVVQLRPWLRVLKGRCGYPGLGLQAAPGVSPWARAGEVSLPAGDVLWLRTCLANRGSQQTVWYQRMWKRLTGSSQWSCRDKGSNHPLHKRSRSPHFSSLPFITNISEIFLLPWMSLTGFISVRALTFLPDP